MKIQITSLCAALCLMTASTAFAQDSVRIPASGDKAVGYIGCDADNVKNKCSADKVQKKEIPAFTIDARPVTNADYDKCVKAGKCGAKGFKMDDAKADHPALVHFDMAEKYCAAQGKKLPTEEQWLAAAMPDGIKKFPWGDEYQKTAAAGKVDAESMEYTITETVPAGSMPKDQVNGVYDMAGNGYEWTDGELLGAAPGEDEACIDPRTRICFGAAPTPIYQQISVNFMAAAASFRCVE